MAQKKDKTSKIAFREKFTGLIETYKSAVVITIDNIRSNHLQNIRKQLRGRGEMIMGKNTFIRKILDDFSKDHPIFTILIDKVKGNCGIVFTNEPLKGVCREIKDNKVLTRAKPGVIAPNDVVVPSGPTGMPPDMTAFFQTLNIPTRIVKGQIEIVNDIDLISKGGKVGSSEVELLSKLDIKPFLFGPQLDAVFDEGKVFPPDVFLMEEEEVMSLFSQAASVVGAIGLESGVPNTVSIAHSLRNTMRVLLAVAADSDYTFKEAEQAQQQMASAAKVEETAPAAEKVEEEEEEEEQDEGAGLGDLFGESDEESSE